MKIMLTSSIIGLAMLLSCAPKSPSTTKTIMDNNTLSKDQQSQPGTEIATFANGCF